MCEIHRRWNLDHPAEAVRKRFAHEQARFDRIAEHKGRAAARADKRQIKAQYRTLRENPISLKGTTKAPVYRREKPITKIWQSIKHALGFRGIPLARAKAGRA